MKSSAIIYNTTLITGTSTSIGNEFAKLFAKEGYSLFLISRNELKTQNLKIEILINNSGIGNYGC
ncbi:MAG: SDR family NAD(P)-dependent oxidoreductase [Ignavibacteria bacterium]|nr:SDR family NAD(P)-dependent oxidoreductase [Ignavibacteria bacterium]